MRARIVLLLTPFLFLGAAALRVGPSHHGAATARAADGPAVSVTLSVNAALARPGEAVATTLELTNARDAATTYNLSCDPANDLRVFDGEGRLVWQLHPDCREVDTSFTLAGGERRSWSALWPGTLQDGSRAPPGQYLLYGIIHMRPLDAIAGPFSLQLGEGDEPRPTATARPPEATATPATSGETFPVTEGDGRRVRPDVAGSPELGDCQNLVVWWDETSRRIYGRFVEPGWRGESILISGETDALGPPKVALNTGRRRWLVVWASGSDAGPTVIRGRYVDCGGLEGAPFRIGLGDDAAPIGDDQPAVADQGEGWVVVWRRSREDGAQALWGGRVAGFGTTQMVQVNDPANNTTSEPAVDCETRGPCLVAWTQNGTGGTPSDVVGRQWWPGEALVAPRHLAIATTVLPESYPSVAWNGNYDRAPYAVTWTEEQRYAAVMARTVVRDSAQPDAYVVGPPAIGVRSTRGGAFHPDVAALGRGFVAVWAEDPRLGSSDVMARRLRYSPDSHDLTLDDVVTVSDAEAAEVYPAVASARDPLALAVWQAEREGGGAGILGRHVAMPTGQVALVGTVTVGGATRPVAASIEVRVRRVLRGTVHCGTVRVTLPSDTGITPPVVGDLVSLRGLPSPSGDPCDLLVGTLGTYLIRGPQLQAHLPFGLAR